MHHDRLSGCSIQLECGSDCTNSPALPSFALTSGGGFSSWRLERLDMKKLRMRCASLLLGLAWAGVTVSILSSTRMTLASMRPSTAREEGPSSPLRPCTSLYIHNNVREGQGRQVMVQEDGHEPLSIITAPHSPRLHPVRPSR